MQVGDKSCCKQLSKTTNLHSLQGSAAGSAWLLLVDVSAVAGSEASLVVVGSNVSTTSGQLLVLVVSSNAAEGL